MSGLGNLPAYTTAPKTNHAQNNRLCWPSVVTICTFGALINRAAILFDHPVDQAELAEATVGNATLSGHPTHRVHVGAHTALSSLAPHRGFLPRGGQLLVPIPHPVGLLWRIVLGRGRAGG